MLAGARNDTRHENESHRVAPPIFWKGNSSCKTESTAWFFFILFLGQYTYQTMAKGKQAAGNKGKGGGNNRIYCA